MEYVQVVFIINKTKNALKLLNVVKIINLKLNQKLKQNLNINLNYKHNNLY